MIFYSKTEVLYNSHYKIAVILLTLYPCPCARPFEFQTFETPILHAPSAGHLAFRIQNIYKKNLIKIYQKKNKNKYAAY